MSDAAPVSLSPSLSVVIVNYNTRTDLHACLTALRASTIQIEIVVVDNASTDGSAEMVSEEFSEVVLVTPGRNTWFTGGNNLGIGAARGAYVILLNPDTIPPPNALERMLTFAQAHPQYFGVTAQLRYPNNDLNNGGEQRTCSRIPTYRYLLLNHTPLGWILRGQRRQANDWHWYGDWDRYSDREIDVPPGSCILARRDQLRLDEDLLLYFPEDDLGQRTPPPRFYFLADVHIVHREKSATNNWNGTRLYFRDLIVYTRKHHGAARAALLWLLSRPLYIALWLKRIQWSAIR